MPKPTGHPTLRQLWREQPGLFRGYLVDVALSASFGLLVILGGRDKTTASAWAVVNHHGGPALWGTVFFAVAVVLVLGAFTSPAILAKLLQVAALIFTIMVIGFGKAALIGESNGTGALLCLYPVINYVLRAQAYLDGPRRPPIHTPKPWTA